MVRAAEDRPDWRDGAPYRALIGIDAAGLAWEWLRRDHRYAAWRQTLVIGETRLLRGVPVVAAIHAAHDWGLLFRRAPRPRRA